MKKPNPKKISQTVETILKKYALLLKYLVLGPKSLTKSELRKLFKSGLIQRKHIKFTIGDAYLDAHFKNLRRPSPKSVREYTIKHLQNNAGHYIDKLFEKQIGELSSIVNQQILSNVNQMRSTVRDELAEGVTQNQMLKDISRRIREKTQDYSKDWDRIVTTEIARAQNFGAMDAIIANNPEKSHDEIFVYKTGPHDSKTCASCKKFWFTSGGAPKVYKLSELMANGTNIGKKARDWLPTVDNTHPNERHFLMELPPSFGFKDGKLSYVGKDHDEYKVQRQKKK